jgi:hypothetical protein
MVSMRTFLIALMLALPAVGQEEWRWAVSTDLVHERVVGLLNLPRLVGEGCGTEESKSVPLYESPSDTGRPLGSIQFRVTERTHDGGACETAQLVVADAGTASFEELPTEESGYEIPAAIVHERKASWFRVARQHGSAWLQGDPVEFRSYPDLLVDGLDYLRKGWDGKLWSAPGGGVAAVDTRWRRYLADNLPVTVLSVRRVGNDAWLEVRLEAESCGETLEGVSPMTGWVPAYRPSGTPSVWFYSRGC